MYKFNKHLLYILGQNEAEVINCTTGKDELGKPSRISKQAFFRRFFNLLGKLQTIEDIDENRCRHYLDAKSSVQDYSVSHPHILRLCVICTYTVRISLLILFILSLYLFFFS